MAVSISIVIPCYNQGQYIQDALDSIPLNNINPPEIIIVNDGSTDDVTLTKFDQLKLEGYHVIDQQNMGLSGARNTGILHAKGDVVILLDADNKIKPAFLNVCRKRFQEDPDIAVVYGNAEYFGAMKGIWVQEPYNLQRLMLRNLFDANAAVRRSVLIEVGLYDTNMKLGWEDWELWLRIAFAGHRFHYENEILFEYRISRDQMSKRVYSSKSKPNEIENYLHRKYPDKLGQQHVRDHVVARFKKSPFHFLTKLIIAAYFPSTYRKLLEKNKIRNGL